jgi:signal transduction histidine kinase
MSRVLANLLVNAIRRAPADGTVAVSARQGRTGLAIVRGIVEAHRGRAAVCNVPGACRFEVHLPAAV